MARTQTGARDRERERVGKTEEWERLQGKMENQIEERKRGGWGGGGKKKKNKDERKRARCG